MSLCLNVWIFPNREVTMQKIHIEATTKSFSGLGGLHLSSDLISQVNLREMVEPLLPRSPKFNQSSWSKFSSLLYGFQCGAECLDDWDNLAEDPSFAYSAETTYTSKSLGDYLRSFTLLNTRQLQECLIDLAFKLSAEFRAAEDPFVLDIDSSLNRQCGEKMEGVEMTYKEFKGLDTLYVFDDLGFQYWHEVRAGNTYTSNSCGLAIHEIAKRLPKTKEFKNRRKLIRADSGFNTSEFMNAASAKGFGFVCAAKRIESFYKNLSTIKTWETSTKIRTKDGRPCELGAVTVHFGEYAKQARFVVCRARKVDPQPSLFKLHDYDYFGFMTNLGAHEMSHEEVVLFYRKRGQCENLIKEQKYANDLRNYPCQKLIANKVFGLIAAFAHNLMRCMAWLRPRKKKTKDGIKMIPHYSKLLRMKWLRIPVQIVRHAGSVTFRYSQFYHQEVKTWLEQLHQLSFGQASFTT